MSERTGRRIWKSGSGGALLGSGTFYSTSAVVYGRVFLGNTDGRVYAYEARTGRLLWTFRVAPAERTISVFGKLISAWPVAGSDFPAAWRWG